MKPNLVVAALILATRATFADLVLEGYHGVTRATCFEMSMSTAQKVVAVVSQVTGGERFRYQLLANGDCVSQGYKFNSTALYKVAPELFAAGLPSGETDPATVPGLQLLRNLAADGDRIIGNFTTVPDSIPLVSEEWTYTVIGGYFAPTTIVQNYKATATEPAHASVQTIDYAWPLTTGLAPAPASHRSELALLGVRGSKVRLRIPFGTARLRLMTLSGKILYERNIASSWGADGEIDLGTAPSRGTYLELKQGSNRALFVVGTR